MWLRAGMTCSAGLSLLRMGRIRMARLRASIARAMVQAISKSGLSQVSVQFRGGTYYLSSTETFTAADSGSPALRIVYQNYPGESPVFSGGVRILNWTNSGGNKWTTTLPG